MKIKHPKIWIGSLISLVVMILLLTFLSHCDKPIEYKAPELAEKALYASVDRPETVEIINFSKADSIFGRNYVNEDEKVEIAMILMKAGQKLMPDSLDFDDPRFSELVDRQMKASTVLRTLMTPNEPTQNHTGWRVKIEYKARTKSDMPYHAEMWFILDKDADCVLNTFEIPLP